MYTPGSFTGKPVGSGGSKGRVRATAQGGIYVLSKYLELTNDSIKNKKIIVEGAGNVGLIFAEIAESLGAKIVGISDSHGAIFNENGISISEIIALKKAKKSVMDYADAEKISDEAMLEKNCDILVPAALENRITENNADKIAAKLIVELANGPTTPEADVILTSKNIPVIPDILANAGGVTVSYFEQVQNNTNFYWEEEEVVEKLQKKMENAMTEVFSMTNNLNTNLRKGAYAIALKRVFDSMKVRNYR